MSGGPRKNFAPEHKVYGRFALAVWGGTNEANDQHVVNVKMADRTDTSNTDWDGPTRLQIQIGPSELGAVLAVLAGRAPAVKLARPNGREMQIRVDANRQTCTVPDDGAGALVLTGRGKERGTARGYRLSRHDQLAISAMVFRALVRNHGGVDQRVLYDMTMEIAISHLKPVDVVPRPTSPPGRPVQGTPFAGSER